MVNELWFSMLPAFLIQKIGPLSLILIGYLVEKNFVGRIATFSNSLAINLHVFTMNNPTSLSDLVRKYRLNNGRSSYSFLLVKDSSYKIFLFYILGVFLFCSWFYNIGYWILRKEKC